MAVAFITQVGEKIILLKYFSLKRRQLREIDLTLSWKNDRSETNQWKAGAYVLIAN